MPEEIRLKLEAEEKARLESHEVSSVEFGDIDDVIAASADKNQRRQGKVRNKGQAGPQQRKPAGKQAVGRQKVSRQGTAKPAGVQAQVASSSEDLLLPNDQWTASSTKSRRKLVTIIASVVGGLLLISALSAAIVANWPSDDPSKIEPEKTADVAEEPEIETPEVVVQEPPAHENSEPETADAPETETNTDEVVAQTPPADDAAIKQPEFEPQGEIESEVAGNVQDDQGSSNKQVTRDGSPNLPDLSEDGGLGKSLDALLDPTVPKSLGAADNATIPDLLQESGTEQAEIKELAASFREQQLIGQSTYYVKKPNAFAERGFKGLALPCSGVQYVDQPMFLVVNEISRLTGTPISFHTDAIRDENLDIAQKISIKETDTDFQSVLSKIVSLSSVPLQLEYDGTGPAILSKAVIDPPGKPYSVELPDLGGKDDAGKVFIELVKQVVTPGVWKDENVVHDIRVEDGKLLVSPTVPRETWRRIERLVKAWDLSKAVVESSEAVPQLAPLVKRAEPFLQKSFKIENKFPESLERFLGKIYQATGVKVLVDWPSLLAEGWSPTAQVPASIGESTVEEFLKQICRAMSVSYRVVDESTIEITTFTTASQKTDFEAYSIASVLGGKHSPDQLLVALKGALGLEVETEQNLRVQLDSESQCLFVHAPQFVQRQVQAILDRLK